VFNLPFWNKQLEIMLKFMSKSTRFFPTFDNKKLLDLVKIFRNKNSIVEAEIVQCRKSLFVGLVEDVIAEKQYLSKNYARQEFYIPNDFLKLLNQYWMFLLFGKSKVPFYHNQFTVAGIPEKLEQLKRERQYLRRRDGTRQLKKLFTLFGNVVPLALTGPIETVFYLYLGMVGACILGYLMETLRKLLLPLLIRKLRIIKQSLHFIPSESRKVINYVAVVRKHRYSLSKLLMQSFDFRWLLKCSRSTCKHLM